jgi:predicted dehydrogenase
LQEVTEMSDAIGFIVVGLGMGRNRAKMVKQTEGAKLVGVVDINEERAKKLRRNSTANGTLTSALSLTDPMSMWFGS